MMPFYNGDYSNRRRVNYGGYSSMERDRRNLLGKTPSGRKQLRDEETAKRRRIEEAAARRLENYAQRRLENFAAHKIQKCFVAFKVFRTEQSKRRQKFLKIYGKNLPDVDRNAFGSDSDFLQMFLYFFNVKEIDDNLVLLKICQLVLQFVGNVDKSGDALRLFAGHDYSSKCDLVNCQMTKLAYVCIRALHHDGNQLKDEHLSESNASDIPLLKVLILLIDLKLPWSCKIIEYLSQYKGFCLLGDIILRGKVISEKCIDSEKGSCLEHLRNIVNCHFGQKSCICSNNDQIYNFSSQILRSPSLLRVFPNMRKIFARQGMISFLISSLPKDVSDKLLPAIHRLIGNVFETGKIPSRGPGIPYVSTIDLAEVATFLLPAQPSLTRSDGRDRKNSIIVEECMTGYDGDTVVDLDAKLLQQICNSIDIYLFPNLTNKFFTENYNAKEPCDRKVVAVGAVSAFLYVIFNTFPSERIYLELEVAYKSDFIPELWEFMKQCHEGGKLSSLSDGATVWLLPLAVFCSVYNNMLKILDNEKFYELKKPLSLKDITSLIILLKQTLWQLLWENHTSSSNSVRSLPVGTGNKMLSVEAIQQEVIKAASELLSQLQDWNNRQEFTSPENFYADGVNDDFISQAVKENTRENEILKQAPFLIPYPIRVKIFNSQKDVDKTSNENRIEIRRGDTLPDVYNKMSHLKEDDLRGKIRVTYVNDQGVEEAGIDLGGLFKDFMENTIRDYFDVQYGLFKETTDHLLYPNPGSGGKHEQHLQLFHFLGTLLAKAMLEGILVDLPFATFFLRKFKDKNDYLKDLRSFDPELYHHLIFVKFYKPDISELGLHFVILDNEYEEGSAELCPKGKNLRVTKENVITYIDLVANHRLNYQTRQQSSPLLRESQQRTDQKKWIDQFDEHKLQDLLTTECISFSPACHNISLPLLERWAMFEEILIDLPSTAFYWRKFKQQHNYMNDLISLDPELYNSLMHIKNYEGDLSELDLCGEKEEEELLPGIRNLHVKKENVIIYIDIRANYRLNCQIRQQSSHFLRGFQQLIKKDWTDMFCEHELQLLISGSPGSLDVDNLQQHTKYEGNYHSAHPVIMMFWEVLEGFSKENKEKFLKFVTSCSRGPLLGFQYLKPLFCIQRAGGNSNEDARDRLPTAATCINLLKLPPYESKDQVETKLLYAINADAGFDLS